MKFREFVWNYFPEFITELEIQLKKDAGRWGHTWKMRPREGQERRIYESIQDYFDQYFNAGVPIPWLKIVGNCMIAWIREFEETNEEE